MGIEGFTLTFILTTMAFFFLISNKVMKWHIYEDDNNNHPRYSNHKTHENQEISMLTIKKARTTQDSKH